MSWEIMDELAGEQGWSPLTQLVLCMEYISNQQDDSAFEDFLKESIVSAGG